MNIKNLLELDCREKRNKEILENELKKLKPFSKCSEISAEKVEKFLYQAQNKYMVYIRAIYPDFKSAKDFTIWGCDLVDETNLNIIACVYGISIDEVMKKTSILIYDLIKNKKLKRRC